MKDFHALSTPSLSLAPSLDNSSPSPPPPPRSVCAWRAKRLRIPNIQLAGADKVAHRQRGEVVFCDQQSRVSMYASGKVGSRCRLHFAAVVVGDAVRGEEGVVVW